jgi:hypothetical protein
MQAEAGQEQAQDQVQEERPPEGTVFYSDEQEIRRS